TLLPIAGEWSVVRSLVQALAATPVARSPIEVGALFRRLAVLGLALLAGVGCTKLQPDPSGRKAFESRASTQQQDQVTVRAAVLGDDESLRFFGASLADKGMQAVWLDVKNNSDRMLYYLPATTDADYYTP